MKISSLYHVLIRRSALSSLSWLSLAAAGAIAQQQPTPPEQSDRTASLDEVVVTAQQSPLWAMCRESGSAD